MKKQTISILNNKITLEELRDLILSGIDISNIDYSHLTDMSYMFKDCTLLVSIPKLDTSNVINMEGMFYYCQSLKSIPFLDTKNVVNMKNMFFRCESLTYIPHLNTSKVVNMEGMFFHSRIDKIPAIDTSNVLNMSTMFMGCRDLVKTPRLNTSKCTDMYYMFENCSFLKEVDLSDTSNVLNMEGMFHRSTNIIQDFSSWNINKNANMSWFILGEKNFLNSFGLDKTLDILLNSGTINNFQLKLLSLNSDQDLYLEYIDQLLHPE